MADKKKNLIMFQPGKSGNPDGRPKGSRNLSTILKEQLEITLSVKDQYTKKTVKKTVAEIINMRLVAKAMRGNLTAISEVYDRVEGKARQTHKLDSDGIKKIEVEFV